jgi:death-on-curing protein
MWRWVDKRLLLVLHGGLSGIRDEELLDCALARPEHAAVYGEPDIAALAASYGVGQAKNHPFVDGNKHAAFLAVGLFLMINGRRLTASQVDATLIVLAVAAGEVDEVGFGEWMRRNSASR